MCQRFSQKLIKERCIDRAGWQGSVKRKTNWWLLEKVMENSIGAAYLPLAPHYDDPKATWRNHQTTRPRPIV